MEICQIYTLTLALSLGTGTPFSSWFLPALCTLRSIMERLISDTAAFDPVSCDPEVLCWGWILFIMSLRELKLSDCGTLRIKGFCEERNDSQLLYQRWLKCFDSQGQLLTLEDGAFSTLELVLFMLLSSFKMGSLLACSRLLLDKNKIILFAGSVALSSSLVVALSSILVLFSKESCLESSFSILRSTL